MPKKGFTTEDTEVTEHVKNNIYVTGINRPKRIKVENRFTGKFLTFTIPFIPAE